MAVVFLSQIKKIAVVTKPGQDAAPLRILQVAFEDGLGDDEVVAALTQLQGKRVRLKLEPE